MPSDPLLNFDELTAPIPGGAPAGSDTKFYTVRGEMEASRSGRNPNDPDAPPEPNWPKVIADAKAALADKCKHVYVGVMLAEALVVQHGFAGVRNGFKLLRLLFEQC